MSYEKLFVAALPYKDFVANLSDIISFFLVTPQLLQKLKPRFSPIMTFTLEVLFGACVMLIYGQALLHIIPPDGGAVYVWLKERPAPFGHILAVFAFFAIVWPVLIPTLMLLDRKRSLLDKISENISKNLFVFGIVVFVLSRLFGLVLAIHDLSLAPS